MFTKQNAERFKTMLAQQKKETENLLQTLNHVYRSLDNPAEHKEFMEIKQEHEYKLKCIISDTELLEKIQTNTDKSAE
jgi:lipopolysaccharide biosynthesis regulator YciM